MSLIYDNVIFDLDGVLIDNSPGIFACIKKACASIGLREPSEEELKKFIGPSLRFSFHEYMGLDGETLEEAVKIYRLNYDVLGVTHFRLYDGVLETLKELSGRGISCSIATGKLQKSVVQIAETSGMIKYIDVIAGFDAPPPVSDKTEKIRAAITGKRPLMVGDRVFDLEGAKKANIPCVYALYGFGNPDEIAAYPDAPRIRSIRELLQIVEK